MAGCFLEMKQMKQHAYVSHLEFGERDVRGRKSLHSLGT